jgi:murein DD-endopeptidase MepM/ murein hydrolase activator NlpD
VCNEQALGARCTERFPPPPAAPERRRGGLLSVTPRHPADWSVAGMCVSAWLAAPVILLLASLPYPRAHATPPNVTRITRPALVYPLMGPRLSSEYGKRKHPVLKSVRHHHGVDLAAPEASPIRSIAAGQVIFADPYAGYGNLIVVKHENGMTSHYGHCHTIKTSIGARIKAGQIIGTVGSTGISTGPHLHFEVRMQGAPTDPEQLLPGLAEDALG